MKKKYFIVNVIDNKQDDSVIICAKNQKELDEKLQIALTEILLADDNTIRVKPVTVPFKNCGCQIIIICYGGDYEQIRISENVIY